MKNSLTHLNSKLYLSFFKACLFKNALKYDNFNFDSYLDGKDTNINIKIVKNCDSTRIFQKYNKVPPEFAPLLVIPTPQMCLHCQRNREEKKTTIIVFVMPWKHLLQHSGVLSAFFCSCEGCLVAHLLLCLTHHHRCRNDPHNFFTCSKTSRIYVGWSFYDFLLLCKH